MNPEVPHCLDKIETLASGGGDDRRAVFQLGYNLGRLSELTGLGREPCWDRWKEAVATWDRGRLEELARDLQTEVRGSSPTET